MACTLPERARQYFAGPSFCLEKPRQWHADFHESLSRAWGRGVLRPPLQELPMNRLALLPRCACLLLALALLPAHVARADDAAPPSLIPLPAQLRLQHSGFSVDAS